MALRAAVSTKAVAASKPRVAAFSRPAVRMTVRASAQKAPVSAQASVALASTSAVAALLASPLAAQAAVTPSLQNFFYSLLAGATVLAAIAGAVTLVSNFDPVNRA